MRIAGLTGHPVEVARLLLGAEVRAYGVRARIVEVEAYGGPEGGPWPDPAAHSYRGLTPRNSVMFGPAGHLYVYLSYGMHMCINVSCGPAGEAAAVLLRAAEIVDGEDEVRVRRSPRVRATRLATGPGNLGQALGITLGDNGTNVLDAVSPVTLNAGALAPKSDEIESGPRVGVSVAADRPWRFWVTDSPSVSAYRRSPRAAENRPTRG